MPKEWLCGLPDILVCTGKTGKQAYDFNFWGNKLRKKFELSQAKPKLGLADEMNLVS